MCSMKKTIVLVGDSGCGKSALAYKLTQKIFLDFYEPTGFDEFQTEIRMDKGPCDLSILDTSGNHEDGDLRTPTYKACDAVVVCFDLTHQASLINVEKFWLPEFKEFSPNVPFYIVGCKKDSMCKTKCSCGHDCCMQTEKELLQTIKRTGAVAYSECSALLNDEGVEEWFKVVVTTCKRKRRGSKEMISKIKEQSKTIRKRLSSSLSK